MHVSYPHHCLVIKKKKKLKLLPCPLPPFRQIPHTFKPRRQPLFRFTIRLHMPCSKHFENSFWELAFPYELTLVICQILLPFFPIVVVVHTAVLIRSRGITITIGIGHGTRLLCPVDTGKHKTLEMLDRFIDPFYHDEGKGRVEDADAGEEVGFGSFADFEFVSAVCQVLDPIKKKKSVKL